jgi:hypothetical protein
MRTKKGGDTGFVLGLAIGALLIAQPAIAAESISQLKAEAGRKCTGAGHVFKVKVAAGLGRMAAWTCTRKPTVAK